MCARTRLRLKVSDEVLFFRYDPQFIVIVNRVGDTDEQNNTPATQNKLSCVTQLQNCEVTKYFEAGTFLDFSSITGLTQKNK